MPRSPTRRPTNASADIFDAMSVDVRDGTVTDLRNQEHAGYPWQYPAAAMAAENPYHMYPPYDPRAQAAAYPAHPPRFVWWLKAGLVAIVLMFVLRVLASLPPHAHREAIGILAVFSLVGFGTWKLAKYAFNGLFLHPPHPGPPIPSAIPAPLHTAPPPPVSTPHTAPAYGSGIPVPVKRSIRLGPETPRLISARKRMSELSQSLTYAAVCAALLTFGLVEFSGILTDRGQVAQFGGTLLAASWLVLAQSKVLEGSSVDTGPRRLMFALSGAAIGVITWWLNRILLVELPPTDPHAAVFSRIGEHPFFQAGPSSWQPSLAGYIVFFVCLMGLHKWWRQVDSFRNKRLAVGSMIWMAVFALAISIAFAFPRTWAAVWAVAISATVQLSAGWVPPRERAALMEGESHV